nr:hypothetical protein [uncultured Undibacterium sp.]
MAFLIIFVLAFTLAFVLQHKGKRLGFSVTMPLVCFLAFVLFAEFVSPSLGSGASIWPIAIIFGAPVVLAGTLLWFSSEIGFGGASQDE